LQIKFDYGFLLLGLDILDIKAVVDPLKCAPDERYLLLKFLAAAVVNAMGILHYAPDVHASDTRV
jgi:hypothetical protein